MKEKEEEESKPKRLIDTLGVKKQSYKSRFGTANAENHQETSIMNSSVKAKRQRSRNKVCCWCLEPIYMHERDRVQNCGHRIHLKCSDDFTSKNAHISANTSRTGTSTWTGFSSTAKKQTLLQPNLNSTNQSFTRRKQSGEGESMEWYKPTDLSQSKQQIQSQRPGAAGRDDCHLCHDQS